MIIHMYAYNMCIDVSIEHVYSIVAYIILRIYIRATG